jgi:hypothetical protein
VKLQHRISGVFIAGSSHTGKTTLARRIAETLDWAVISTDTIARHPGRPWPDAHAPVAEYYSRLTAETIYWFLRVHHENMWPRLLKAIDDVSQGGIKFVAEGSALRPEYVASLITPQIVGLCLYADTDFLRNRMRYESKYASFGKRRQGVIDKFIDREVHDNAQLLQAARMHGFTCVDASDPDSIEHLFTNLIADASKT